jgi:hypothetical protein
MSGGQGAGAPPPGATPNSRVVTSLLTGAARGVYGLVRALTLLFDAAFSPTHLALDTAPLRLVGQEPVLAGAAVTASAGDKQPW